jgi:hypothetical protein
MHVVQLLVNPTGFPLLLLQQEASSMRLNN